MADSHEKIDELIAINALNKIKPSSIQQIAHGKDWAGGKILYKAQTENPDKNDARYILRYLSTMPTEGVREQDHYNLNRTLQQNPSFADTLASSQVPGLLKQMQEDDRPSVLARLIDKIKGWF